MAEYPELKNNARTMDPKQDYQFRDPAFDKNIDEIGSGLQNRNRISSKVTNIISDFNNRENQSYNR